MGIAIWALIVYIAVIIAWNGILKRNIGEAMIVSFLVVCAFSGAGALDLVWAGVLGAAAEPIVFAALTFVFMSFVITRTGLIERLIDMLNSLLGRLRGGAGYCDTVASALFGAISGSGSGNTASTGSVTIPWMQRSNWSREMSATVAAGNSGLGIAIPPSSSMFLLLGTASVAPVLSAGQLFLPLLIGGLWTLLYRFALLAWFTRRHQIGPVPAEQLMPFRRSFAQGWTSLLLFVGIAVPLLLTIGPGAVTLERSLGAASFESIDIIVWIPVMVTLVALALGWRQLPNSLRGWSQMLGDFAPRYAVVGATLFFAFAAATALTELGLSEQLSALLAGLEAPRFVVALLVGILVAAVAAPLTSTATIAAIGGVAFAALTTAGIDPVLAAVAILIFASTEGSSPPSAAPIFIASGIAGVDPGKTFVPLILYYVLPILAIGILIAIGFLPILA